MSNKSLFIGAIVIAVYLFAIDFLYYGAMDFLALIPAALRPMPDFLFLTIGYLVFGLFFTYLGSRFQDGLSTTSKGFTFGLIVGFLVYGLTTLNRYATEQMDLFVMMNNLIFSILKIGLAGIVLTWILRPAKFEQAPPN